MLQLLIISIVLQKTISFTRINLQGASPQYMDCSSISENDNGFLGTSFFYDNLSQSGSLLNLDKITFTMWFWVHQKMILQGKQILFAFVDGNSKSPFLNLMLYYYLDQNGYSLNLLNEDLVPDLISLKLQQTNDLYKESWNYVLLSIDQSTSFTFINLKFFSSSNYQLQQIQETLVSQKLNYQFGPHSRITNEQLYGLSSDYKACVSIVNFDYTNGWTTMDSEIYIDYDVEQVFSLKPYASKGLDVTNLYTDVQLKSYTNNLEYTGSIGLNIYKDTQIVYNFLEQMNSFTIMFWFKPFSIQSNFQFLSLTDDSILETSIGFGVDKFYKLLIYQIYSKTQVTSVDQNAWNNIKIGFLEISRDENFISTSENKIIRIYKASNQVYLSKVQNIKAYKRLVIGPVFVDDRGYEVIDIQDIRIFNGYSLLEQNGDCLLFVGLYCGSCKSGTDYCYERNPYDDLRVYNCPGGYREDGDYCVAISVQNCRRFSNGACQQCDNGYYFSVGQCIKSSSNQISPFDCQDISAQFCQNTIIQQYNQNPSISSKSKLCKNNLYNSQSYGCGQNSVQACSISQYNSQCYTCWNNYALTEAKVCRSNCNQNRNDRFLNGQYCLRKCPYKYLFQYVCSGTYIDYQCNPNVYCKQGELDIGYYCLTDKQQKVGQTTGCKNRYRDIQYDQQIVCHNSCKYCFGGSDKNCLGCYNGLYYSPYTTSCTTNCNNNSNQFKFTNKIKMICEYECPSYLYTQGYDCVDVCSSGYVLYKSSCLLANSVPELYSTISTMKNYNGVQVSVNKYNLCPYLCSGCTSQTYCTSCLNSYPIYQNQCLLSCYPKYLYVSDDKISSCLDNCDTNDLIFQNDDFYGTSLKQCFKSSCGTVKANKNYQTYQHQTNNKICSYPCEDGYYGHPVTLQCTPCNSSCATCLNFANYCTACSDMKFLQDSDCFDSCKSKFSNYVTWTCEGSCSQGYAIYDKDAGIKACVETCGQIFATYIYSLNGYCLQTKPTEKAYCIGYNCYNCHSSCKQCSGSLSNQCLACPSKTYLLNNVCVTDCGTQKYDTVNWQCVDTCPQSSYISSGNSLINSVTKLITMCAVTCQFSKYQLKDLCYDGVPSGANCEFRTNYYYCEKCSSVCLECVQNFPTKCTKCPTNYYLLVNTCYTDCPESAPFKNTQNQTCVNNCQNYQEDGICVNTCQSTSYVYASQKQCYSAGCPYGTYIKSNTQQCYDCYSGCTSCVGGSSNDCLSCATNYYFNQGTSCTSTCNTDPDFVYDQVNWKCVSTCPDGTFLQTSADGKLVCRTNCPQYYYSNICVTSCPDQTYLDGVSCLSCAGPCSICNGPNFNQCSLCDQGFYRDNTTCYEACPPLKPLINLVDQTCVASCTKYLYLEKMICFETCPSYLYYYDINSKKECIDSCYSKSYLTLGHCLSCHTICKECYGPDNGNCIQCELPYFLDKQTCTLTCPQFYDSSDHICKDACPVNLVVQGSNCQQQCDSGFVLYNQICQLTCPTFSYLDNNQCYDCHLFCDSCFGPTSTQCNSCIQDYYLSNTTCYNYCEKLYDDEDRLCLDSCGNKLEVVDQQKCVSLCPSGYLICESKCLTTLSDGYYSDGIQCQKCDSKCTICTSLTECQACSTNFYLEVQSCVNQCSNKYLYMDPISKTCIAKCPSQLFHLESFGKRFCVYDCQFKLYDQCVTECPIGMYSDNKICKKCSSTCLQCSGATQCQVCLNGYYLENGSCLLTCLTDKTDRKNVQCVTQCDPSLYEYQNECLENCPTSPLIYENKMLCTQSCPNSTYLQQQECLDCDISCSACIGPTNSDCISCNIGYYLDNQICTDSCTDLYDMVNLKCVLTCPDSLYQNQNQCVSICPQFTFNKECLSSCPIQTYDYNLICYDCSDNCLSCNHNGCLECGNTTYLNDGLCSSICSVLYDDVKFECVEACPNQTFLYIDHCYSQCPINTYQYKTNCLLICPSLTVFNNGICEECPERCSNCKNIATCLECFSPYYLFDGQCVVNCPLIMPYADVANGVCLEQCTPDVYIKKFECVKDCDLVIYQTQCLEKCPNGYYGKDICKPCRLECKLCDDWEVCTQCSDNYYLEYNQCDTQCTKIKDLQKQQCVDTCDKLLYKNVCYQQCPLNTYEYGSICVVNCNDGYYGSDQWKCEKCSNKCSLCTSLISCQKCKTGYFLYNTDCLSSCPNPLYSNSIINECSSSCPVKTFVYQNQCLFDCPDTYYNDIENYKCVENCSNNQYLVKKNCYPCSIECDGCYGNGNENCIKCASNYAKDDNGFCQGTTCKTGYYKANSSCQKCLHKCSTCNNGLDCIKCRGTNRKAQDCSCSIGYYDDEFYEECQKCPCDECTSSENCLVCNNNLQLPKCSCDRQLNADWCITCQVGKVKIQFSDDLDQINVYFGYLVTVNLINPFQPSDCSQWFDNSEAFGTNATCYLAWDRFSVIINLQPYSTINIGDKLDFKQDFYRDIDQGLCDQEYISTFIENQVYAPTSLMKPYIEFSVPSFVSACKEIEIKQILKSGTAKRIQKILNWQLSEMENEEYYLQMDTFLALQKNEIVIPSKTLQPNTTYKITAKYLNMLDRVNYTSFTFTTLPIQSPYVYFTLDPLIAHVYVFDCHVSFQDMTISFFIQIDIVNKKDTSINYISLQEQINPIYKVELNETLLPKETLLLFKVSTGSSIITETITLRSKNIEIQFLQTDRFIGLDNQINARGYDRNIQDEILSTKDITYEWLCTNLYNLQPCKTDENQIMQFPSRRIANIYADSQNTTLVFYVKASKQQRWNVKEQLIVVTDFNIEEQFYYNSETPKNYINPNDEITILIKNQQNYAFIIRKHKVIQSQKIVGQTLKFRLADFSTHILNPVYIYLVPGKESIAFQLNQPPKDVIFTISPEEGKAMDQFNYTLVNQIEGSQISIYYYFNNSTLKQDIDKQQTLNGFPLIMDSNESTGSFQLPNGISDNAIAILLQIEASYGAKSYITKQVKVIRQNYELSSLINSFNISSNQTNLNSLHTMVTLISLEQSQVCLKQCSGVGTCENQKCICPPGYYFEDCSGNQTQYSSFLSLIDDSLKQLIKQNISNNDEFKLYSQSLQYFSNFMGSIDGYSVIDCQKILQQYVTNTNKRLEQINQYSLNLQYYSTGDFNFSQIDIRSIVNQADFYTALESTVFMWNKTLFSTDQSVYQLQRYLQEFITNIIDLSLISISFDEELHYQIGVADIKIMKTSNLSQIVNTTQQSSRILLESINTTSTSYYDVILSIYIRNFYALDGYFPYPTQTYPLYDYQVRNSNKKQNIVLQNNISYKFQIYNNTENLVCLIRNSSTYYWENDGCYIDQMNETYYCNCSVLAPTTIVNDLQYLYQGSIPFYLNLPNIFFLVYLIQLIILLIVSYKAKSQQGEINLNQQDQIKYGQVFKLVRSKKILGFNKEIKEFTTNEKEKINSEGKITINNQQTLVKFHFNQFWKHHILTSIIFNQKFYLSIKTRIISQIIKLNLATIIGQVLVLYNFSFWIILSTVFGSIIVMRVIESLTYKNFKFFTYKKLEILIFLIKFSLILVLIGSFAIIVYLYLEIEYQTYLILCHSISYSIDWLIIDLFVFSANRFLGQEMKKQIRYKLKNYNQHKECEARKDIGQI